MKDKLSIFLTGFLQVSFISANTYFISRSQWVGIAVCGFLISYLWTINVKKVAIGTTNERIIYSLGAMIGGLFGVITAHLINKL